jgi:hypothetical protein
MQFEPINHPEPHDSARDRETTLARAIWQTQEHLDQLTADRARLQHANHHTARHITDKLKRALNQLHALKWQQREEHNIRTMLSQPNR